MATPHHGMQVLSKDDPDASIHEGFMRLAIEQAEKSIPVPSGYCVGAVLVRKRTRRVDPRHGQAPSATDARFEVVTTGFSRELPGNTHAEECCLLKLEHQPERQDHNSNSNNPSAANDVHSDNEQVEWVMYSTMEPCSHRLSGNRPCSDRLIASRVRTVYVGVREPDHFVQTVVGVEDMVQHGLTVIHIPGFEDACLAPNRHILGGP